MLSLHNKLFIVAVVVVHFVHFTMSCEFDTTTHSTNSSIPYQTRAYWMRRANSVLSELVSPCPLFPFAAVIVNHTSANELGELICSGVNQVGSIGDPTRHGEMVAISNCSSILTDQNGRYRLSPEDALSALAQLSLYSNAESCPMCASAIRWGGFKEYIYGTSIRTLIKGGWNQIRIESHNIFSASDDLGPRTAYIPNVLNNETDPYFMWQYNPRFPCPEGCRRRDDDDECMPYEEE